MEKELTCQDCKNHKNRPSLCVIKDEFIPRKEKICKDFKRRKNGKN